MLEVMCRNMVAIKLLCRTSISAVLVANPARLTSLSGVVVRSCGSATLAHCELLNKDDDEMADVVGGGRGGQLGHALHIHSLVLFGLNYNLIY